MSNRIALAELETYLYASADILRGHVEASDYKSFVFPLLFFKRICDVYDEETTNAIKEYGEDGDKDVSYVEDCKVKKLNLEHILYIAIDDTVDHVADTAGGDHNKTPSGQTTGYKICCQCQNDKQTEHTSNDYKVDSCVAAAENTESGTVIMDIYEGNYAGNELDDIGAEKSVLNPELYGLVNDDYQDTDY